MPGLVMRRGNNWSPITKDKPFDVVFSEVLELLWEETLEDWWGTEDKVVAMRGGKGEKRE